jgi:VanZ family protein
LPVWFRIHLPFLLWATLIVIASSVPIDQIPTHGIFRADKLLHLGVYAVLAFLAWRSFRHQRLFPNAAVASLPWTVAFIALFGVADEIHQVFTPGRSSDPGDILADVAGALVWVGIALLLRKRRPELLQKLGR